MARTVWDRNLEAEVCESCGAIAMGGACTLCDDYSPDTSDWDDEEDEEWDDDGWDDDWGDDA